MPDALMAPSPKKINRQGVILAEVSPERPKGLRCIRSSALTSRACSVQDTRPVCKGRQLAVHTTRCHHFGRRWRWTATPVRWAGLLARNLAATAILTLEHACYDRSCCWVDGRWARRLAPLLTSMVYSKCQQGARVG